MEKHLVVTIGEHVSQGNHNSYCTCSFTQPPSPPHTHTHMYNHTHLQSYMALPKGGLVTEHVLVLPIGHYAASTDTPQVSWSIGLVYTVMIDEFLYIGSFG